MGRVENQPILDKKLLASTQMPPEIVLETINGLNADNFCQVQVAIRAKKK